MKIGLFFLGICMSIALSLAQLPAEPLPIYKCAKECRPELTLCMEKKLSLEECSERIKECISACPEINLTEIVLTECGKNCRMEYDRCREVLQEEECRRRAFVCISKCPELATIRFEKISITIRAEAFLKPETTIAKDVNNESIELTGEKVSVEKREGKFFLILPVMLEKGRKLDSLISENVKFVKRKAKLPVFYKGEKVATLKLITKDAIGRGEDAVAEVKKMKIETLPITADFSDADPRVGVAEINISAELKELPEKVELEVTPMKSIPPKVMDVLQKVAENKKLKMKDIAYGFEIKKLGEIAGHAKIRLKVDRKWADGYGVENVRIFRVPEFGPAELLPTNFVGYEENRAVFEASSPGLSVFSLAAVEEEAPEEIVIPGFGILALVLAFLVIVKFEWRKKSF